MDKNSKKQVAKISVFITSIFVIFLSVTYAFINMTLVGTKRQVITAGSLELELEENNELIINNAMPLNDEVGMLQNSFDFRLVNSGVESVNYVLKLVDVTEEENKLGTSIIRFGLTKDGVTSIENLSTLLRNNIDMGTIRESQTIEYELRLWIDSSVEDETLINAKTFKCKLELEMESTPAYDIQLASVKIDGQPATSLPTIGTYILSNYTCKKGTTVKWDTYNKAITFSAGTKKGESCGLEFTTSIDYPLLVDKAKQGDYVAYEGNNGCMKDGTPVTGTSDAESGNSCLGYNANDTLDTSGYTYGYCYSANYKFYVKGWRIAYTDDTRAYLTSAGSPECNTRTSSTGNATFISEANTKALKYCNTAYVDGSCDSTNAWALGEKDFERITAQMTGTNWGYLYDTNSNDGYICSLCDQVKVCGYNNDLFDNGGYYWLAVGARDSGGYFWHPVYRGEYKRDSTDAFGLRPIIRLSSSVIVTGGSGTMDDPYTIVKQ